ncbi:MAG: hypothetical protein ACOVNZ_09115 [Crocinitomicaceae bacterium]
MNYNPLSLLFMKQKFILPGLLLFGILHIIGCSNQPFKNTDGANPNDSKQVDSIHQTTDAIAIVEKFRLTAIEGHYAPAGGHYLFDKKKNLWCEIPSMATVMSYTQGMEMENPEKETKAIFDDLTTYFSKSETKKLNSCEITLSKKGLVIEYTLEYLGKTIQKEIIDQSTRKEKSFNFTAITPLDFSEFDGSMLLSKVKKYTLNLEKEPTIQFSDDMADYTLDFEKVQ